MGELLKHLGQSSLYRVAFHSSPAAPSRETLASASNTTDLILYYSEMDIEDATESNKMNGTIHHKTQRLQAIYNQRFFSSARVSAILGQLLQLIQNVSLSPMESIGKMDLMTDTQRTVLPDPRKDLHW